MWLINTDNYTLHEVYDHGEDHPYAILSHTWEESEDDPLQREVTFYDMRDLDVAQRMSGWAKIERTCALAKEYEPSLKWAWIDTCCIDKSSSAELTEAINSMFSWYRRAKVCFVYFSDLPRSPTADLNTNRSRDHMNDFFPRCRWFTRGWTLQELIAPSKIEFYDTLWRKRGTKMDLKRIISKKTGIDQAVLDDSENLSTVPVGRRMSWVSERSTKRVEDIAYCLFGIFDVNMPLIYGEGNKAFIRLQTAIAQQTNDLSLFAWSVNSSNDRHELEAQKFHGIFAQSPDYFKCCSHITSLRDPLIFERQSFTVTNRGLEFQVSLKGEAAKGDYMMNLFCQNNKLEFTGDNPGLMVIRLVRTIKGFVRHCADKVLVATDVHMTHIWPGNLISVHVPMVVSVSESRRLEARLNNAFRFRVQSPSNISVKLLATLGMVSGLHRAWEEIPRGPHSWDSMTCTFLTGGYPMFTGMIWPSISGGEEGSKWPYNLRIMVGLTYGVTERRSDAEPAFSLQPWLTLIGGHDDCIEIGGNSTADLFAILEKNIEMKEPYGPAVSALGHALRQVGHDVFELPKSAILTPCRAFPHREKQPTNLRASLIREKQPKEAVNLSLILKNIEESGVVVHEVTIWVE